uniref:Uncharacterized protein n=1 Tax=Parascaris univalens TaxID=6257 RepID=A0A915ARI1_PARUN
MNAEPAPGYDIFRPKCGFATKEERSQKGPVLRSSRTAAAKNRVRVKHKSSPPIEKAESALSKEQKDPMKISSSMKKRHRDSADSLSSNKQRIKSSDVNDEKLPPKKSQSTPLSPSTENKWNQTSSLSRKGIQHQRPTESGCVRRNVNVGILGIQFRSEPGMPTGSMDCGIAVLSINISLLIFFVYVIVAVSANCQLCIPFIDLST